MAKTKIAERSTYWVSSGGSNPVEDGDYRCYWAIYYDQTDSDRKNNQSQLIIDYYVQTHKQTSSYADVISYSSTPSTVNIDGSKWHSINTGSGSIVVGDSWKLKYIGSYTKAISHNQDGTRSFTFQASGFGKGTATSTYTLPTIPRNSVLGDITTFNVDDGVTVPTTKYVTSYYDRLIIKCKDTNTGTTVTIKTVNNIQSGDKITFTDTELNNIYSIQASGSSTQIIFELSTYSDANYTTKIGSSSEKTVTGNLTIVAPVLNGYDWSDTNISSLALSGDFQTIIKGISTLTVSIPPDKAATAKTRGATISHYVIDGVSVPYDADMTSKSFEKYNKDNVSVQAVDSRGTGSATSVTVFANSGTFINYYPISKDDNQSYSRNNNEIGPMVTISFSGTWWQGNFGKNNSGDDNTLTASYKFKKSTVSSYTTGKTTLSLNTSTANRFSCSQLIAGDQSDNGFDISETYDIVVTVTDATGASVQYNYSIHAGEPAVALYKNKASLGAAYDESLGGTQLWGNVYLNKTALKSAPAFSEIFPIGYIYMSMSETSPETLFPGTKWERLENVFLLGASSTHGAGSTGGSEKVALTVNQLPKHGHPQNYSGGGDGDTNRAITRSSGGSTSGDNIHGTYQGCYMPNHAGWSSTYYNIIGTGRVGNDEAHENMPPYLAVYMWQRTA